MKNGRHTIIRQKQNIERFTDLRHDLKDSLIVVVMVMSLPNSYASLQQYLYIKKESKLIMEFVTKQILMEENSHGNTSHVTLDKIFIWASGLSRTLYQFCVIKFVLKSVYYAPFLQWSV